MPGTKQYQNKLPPYAEGTIKDILPIFASAIKRQENDPTRHGVRAIIQQDPNADYQTFKDWNLVKQQSPMEAFTA